MLQLLKIHSTGGGQWQGYRSWERKEKEGGDLKGWEAGEKVGNYAKIIALYFTSIKY